MKKKIIIVSLALLAVVSIVIGVFLVKNKMNLTYDFCISTESGESYLLFENACKTEPNKNMSYKACEGWLNDADDFYETFVKANPNYLYSVDKNNGQTQTETGNYVFLKNKSYFFVSVRNGKIYGSELDCCFWFLDNTCTHASIPFVKDDSIVAGCYGDLSRDEISDFTWTDAPGINSFSDLAAYYVRIEAANAVVDEENQTINVPTWKKDAEENRDFITDEYVQIKVTENGVQVAYVSSK